MRVNWRYISASRNSYAALYAACEREGHVLRPVQAPERDITCYSLNSLNAPVFLREIADADCITIAGGPHATACYREVCEVADYVVVGEGEFVLPGLIAAIEGGRPPPPGVATAKNRFIPADTCVLMDAYPPFSRMKGYVEISRGCPFRCGYCQTPYIFGPIMRHRSIDSIVRFASRYRDARFVTPNALAYGSDGKTPRLEKVEALLKSLRADGRHIYFGTFPSEVRPEFVTDAALELIIRYCSNTRLHFGGQSGSDHVLKALQRGHSVEDTVTAVERCRDHGITPIVDFIIGLPFESHEDQRATAALVEWICRAGMVRLHRFLPLPGTRLAGHGPRPLLPEVESLFGSLALHGHLTGSWSDPTPRFF